MTYIEQGNGNLVRTHYKERVRDKARKAELRGTITRTDYCEACGAQDVPLTRHHPSYFKPCKIYWLCKDCHRRINAGEKLRRL